MNDTVKIPRELFERIRQDYRTEVREAYIDEAQAGTREELRQARDRRQRLERILDDLELVTTSS